MKKIIGIIALLTAFVSCRMPQPGDVRLDRFYGVETQGISLAQSRMTVKLGMVNDARTRITLREADLHIFNAQGEILQALLDTPIHLAGRSTTQVELPLTLRFKGGLGALTALSRLTQTPENLRVSGIVRLQAGSIRKTYEVEDEPLRDFLQSIGIDPEEIF